MNTNSAYSEAQYKMILLKKVSEKELEEWLKKNKPPVDWETEGLGVYQWASEQMAISKFFTWFRKVMLGWKID